MLPGNRRSMSRILRYGDECRQNQEKDCIKIMSMKCVWSECSWLNFFIKVAGNHPAALYKSDQPSLVDYCSKANKNSNGNKSNQYKNRYW